MRWGLVPWHWKKPLKQLKLSTFNARVETVATKPMFRDAFKRRRCLIPASGYYEWEDTPDGKQPHYFTARDGSPVLTMAGLWDEWKNVETKERLMSCTMLITEPNRFVAEVPDRMPVILNPEQFDSWLYGSMGVDDIKTPIDDDYLRRRRVARRVNSSRAPNDDPTLIDQAAEFYANEQSALEIAANEFKIPDTLRNRLVARREAYAPPRSWETGCNLLMRQAAFCAQLGRNRLNINAGAGTLTPRI